MPFAFPSHQGLIAPLWRRFPDRFNVLALWVGALVPDAVDGALGIALAGRPGQSIGHSLLGLFVACVPGGLLVLAGIRALLRRTRRAATWIRAADNPSGGGRWARFGRDAYSVWIGALSHIAFDLVSHEHSKLLWPWAEDPQWFGAAWYRVWSRVSIPGYPDYPIAPHFILWLALSVVGAWMFLKYRPRAR